MVTRGLILLALASGIVLEAMVGNVIGQTQTWRDPGRCGTNCLYIFLNVYPGELHSFELTASNVDVGSQGSSILQLQECAQKAGIECDVLQIQTEALQDLQLPVIAHLDLSDHGGAGHFLTVLEFVDRNDRSYVRIFDGGDSTVKVVPVSNAFDNFSGFVLARKRTLIQKFAPAILIGLSFICGIFVARLVCSSRKTRTPPT